MASKEVALLLVRHFSIEYICTMFIKLDITSLQCYSLGEN